MCYWSAFGSAVIGGVLAGAGSWIATQQAHKNNLKKQKTDQERTQKALLQAIHDELETLWQVYQDGMGRDLVALDDNKALLMYYPLTQEYITVYRGNSSLIGSIDDPNLRKAIVATYIKVNGLIDSFKMNNGFVQEYEHWDWVYNETKKPTHESRKNAELASLAKYAGKLKKAHNDLENRIQELLSMLRKQGESCVSR